MVDLVPFGRFHLLSILSRLFPNEDQSEWLLSNHGTMIALNHDAKYLAVAKQKSLFAVKVIPHLDVDDAANIKAPSVRDISHFENACTTSLEEQITWIEWFTTPASSGARNNATRQRHKERNVLIVGTSEGYIRLFTERGALIHEQRFHSKPVRKIRTRAASPFSPGESEDILVVYAGIIVRIEGKPFCKFIRRRTMEMEQNSGATASSDSHSGEEEAFFTYKKWELTDNFTLTDVISCGLGDASPLDIYTSRPAAHRFIVVGAEPILASYVTIEDEQPPISSAVALSHVATKVTSAVFSFAKAFIWGAPPQPEKEEVKEKKEREEPATPLTSRMEFHDNPRQIQTISLDLTGRFAVASDSLGRVLVIDVFSLVIMRIFKGYRDAQCTWLYVPADDNDGSSEPALYVLIYAPRRGLLEIWDIASGKRLAAANIGSWKCCQLIQTPSLMGATTSSGDTSSPPLQPGACFLATPSGDLYRIMYNRKKPEITTIANNNNNNNNR